MARWPHDIPLAALWSGPDATPNSRWSILAPIAATTLNQYPPALLHDFATPQPRSADPDAPPFSGGHIGHLSFDLAPDFEPTILNEFPHPARAVRAAPKMTWHHCPWALAFDRVRSQWWSVGESSRDSDATLQTLRSAPASNSESAIPTAPVFTLDGPGSGALESARRAYTAAVAVALAHIAAGNIYQVNLAHALRFAFTGAHRALFLTLAAATRPWYGALIEAAPPPSNSPGLPSNPSPRHLLSFSPELFLNLDAPDGAGARRITTRPMKGTRPAATSPSDLLDSEKDAAELTMIVDLMRNDLARICTPASIRVERRRDLERHGLPATGVLQSTATIAGTLRPRTTLDEIFARTFPPGSVTGAPKVRALQIIRALERFPRGPYCGVIGYVSVTGHAAFNVAIRTAEIDPHASTLTYPVGAGIVWGSDAETEWRETITKAAAILKLAIP
ncbi:hypothetical protein BH11PLA1_BH11PLA1_01300 [soil metagenome]